MGALRQFNNWLVTLGSWGTILFMSVIAVVIPYEVIGRYLFARMTIWSGEVSTYSLVWASMLGGAVGLRKGYQIRMTSVLDAVPAAAAQALKTVGYLCALFFFGVMTGYGIFQALYNLKQTSPATGMVLSIPYAALPTGFLIMFSLTLEEFLLFLRRGAPGAER